MEASTIRVEFDEPKIDKIFDDLDQCHLPGAAVGIAFNGKPVYRKGFGLASMELPVVLSPAMRMRIYSTSKHFTCLAYLLLCEERRAAIDSPLGEFLPELHPVTHQVSLRQLMGNVGGLRDSLELNWAFGGMAPQVSSDELLSFYQDMDDVNFAPGTAWSYSNGGFLLLGAVIERITGQPLEQVLREKIFEPVGMNDTQLRRSDSDFVPNSATMHMTRPGGGFDRYYEGAALDGGSGIVSTVDDMLRWLAHMDTPWIGNAATWEAIKTPQRLANGTSTNYGCGLIRSQYRGAEIVHHSGSGLGANGQMLKVPDAGLDVVVLVNRHDVAAVSLTNRILDACLRGLDPVASATTGKIARGTFYSRSSGRVVQLASSFDGGPDSVSTQMASINGADYVVEASADDDRLLRPVGAREFMKLTLTLMGDAEEPSSVRLHDYGNLDEFERVSPAKHPGDRDIVGRYRCDSVGAECSIFSTGRDLHLGAKGRFGAIDYDLTQLGETLWRATPGASTRSFIRGILKFDASRSGFGFSSHSTCGLRFERCS